MFDGQMFAQPFAPMLVPDAALLPAAIGRVDDAYVDIIHRVIAISQRSTWPNGYS